MFETVKPGCRLVGRIWNNTRNQLADFVKNYVFNTRVFIKFVELRFQIEFCYQISTGNREEVWHFETIDQSKYTDNFINF